MSLLLFLSVLVFVSLLHSAFAANFECAKVKVRLLAVSGIPVVEFEHE